MTGTVRPTEMIAQQLAGQWFLLQQPLAAVLFLTCMLAEANRLPFDLAEAEQELVGGWHTEYSSLKWAFFFMAEYDHIIVGSAFFTVLFLGGWSINPFTGADLAVAGGLGTILLQVAVVVVKVFGLVLLAMAVRWTLPRFRYDQLMRLAWEGMIPTAMLVLLVTSVFVYLGWADAGRMWIGSLLVLAVVWLARPLLARKGLPNKKVRLAGSRFSALEEEAISH
jgi:NADH-quinone oxidoreductase subunit H